MRFQGARRSQAQECRPKLPSEGPDRTRRVARLTVQRDADSAECGHSPRCPKGDHATGLPTQFLDGAAGVMYTSFLGLILDDLIALGTGKYKKC